MVLTNKCGGFYFSFSGNKTYNISWNFMSKCSLSNMFLWFCLIKTYSIPILILALLFVLLYQIWYYWTWACIRKTKASILNNESHLAFWPRIRCPVSTYHLKFLASYDNLQILTTTRHVIPWKWVNEKKKKVSLGELRSKLPVTILW